MSRWDVLDAVLFLVLVAGLGVALWGCIDLDSRLSALESRPPVVSIDVEPAADETAFAMPVRGVYVLEGGKIYLIGGER